MQIQTHNKDFLVEHIGIGDLAPYQQEEILGYLWQAIHNRIFDKLEQFFDGKMLQGLEERFNEESDAAIQEVQELVPEWNDISAAAAKEVIAEFKKVRDTMKS